MEKMDRLTAIRMGAMGGAGVFMGGKFLGDAADALAMNSRFDTTLKLTNGIVRATGPTGLAADEVHAHIYAFVAQGSNIQRGSTAWVSASTWAATLVGPKLKPGYADAYGLAYVENKDGSYEWYPWEVAVTLR